MGKGGGEAPGCCYRVDTFLQRSIPDPRLPKSKADYNFLLGTCPRIIAELERPDANTSWGLAINDMYVLGRRS